MFSYYFINAMVTISGIIFLVYSQTSVVASKIKELQHFAKFNEIFVLSILIFFTNLFVKLLCDYLQKKRLTMVFHRSSIRKKRYKDFLMINKYFKKVGRNNVEINERNKLSVVGFRFSDGIRCTVAKQAVIQRRSSYLSNGDEEAVVCYGKCIDGAGYEGQYLVQSLGTSELGGKLLAEGDQIEADLVTMSSYFVESAQEQHSMFRDLSFETKALEEYPSYYTPILANTGAIFVNTEVLKENGLAMPTSIKDLTKPEFRGLVSIPNIMDSSTGWLLIQAMISEYGEEEGKTILHDLVANVGPHLESSGSGPIKKVQAGEVAARFWTSSPSGISERRRCPN